MSENARIIISVCFVIFFLWVTINIILDYFEEKIELNEFKKWKNILHDAFGVFINKFGNDVCFELGADDSWLEFKVKEDMVNKLEKCREIVAEVNNYLGLESYILQLLYFNDTVKYQEIRAKGFIIAVNFEKESEIRILYCRSTE